MHQSVKLTGAIWLLHLVISSPLIHALVWSESSSHWNSNSGPQHERRTTYQLSYPSPSSVLKIIWSKLQMNTTTKSICKEFSKNMIIFKTHQPYRVSHKNRCSVSEVNSLKQIISHKPNLYSCKTELWNS